MVGQNLLPLVGIGLRELRLGQKFGSVTSKRFWSYCAIGALSSKEDKRPEMLTSVKRRGYYGRFFHFHSSLKGGQNVMICHSQSKVGHTTIIYWLQYSTMYNYSRTVGTYRDLGTGPWFLKIFLPCSKYVNPTAIRGRLLPSHMLVSSVFLLHQQIVRQPVF